MRAMNLLRIMSTTLLLASVATGIFRGGEALALEADKVDKAPNLDGVPGADWPRELGRLSNQVRGSASASDLSAKGLIAYDDKNVYVAVDVTDDKLRGGADRVDLVIGASTGETISIYPGQPGKTAGKATKNGAAIASAKVVEAPGTSGWTLEASIPWSSIGDGMTRVGLRAGLFVQDADDSDSPDAAVGSSASADFASLPELATSPEQALADGLVKEKSLGKPLFSFLDNVAGNGEKERVLVYDKYLVVLGSSFHAGTGYYFTDITSPGASLSILSCELKDADGDARKDLVFKNRFTEAGVSREVLDIETFGTGETATPLLKHEVGISNAKGSISNVFAFSSDGAKLSLEITPGTAKGLTQDTYSEPTETSFDPVLLPWGLIDSQTYKIKGGVFAKASEKTHKATEAPKPVVTTSVVVPPTVAPKSVPSDRVYAAFKKDRKVGAGAKFDLLGDVDDDFNPERVALHDKDLVILGNAFKGGAGYTYLTLPFDKASDITSVSMREVTGDKKFDILVRGVLHSKAPKDAGGGDVDREVELVYRVVSGQLKRVFAAEISRSMAGKKITAELTYQGGKATLSPGKATGFTEQNYPFNQDSAAVGGFEPLPLPWGGASATTYTYAGDAFSK